MNQASRLFLLQTVEQGSWVGMVTFDSTAYVQSELTQLNSGADRDLLIKRLPTVASGGTSICSGLQAAFTVRRSPLWLFATIGGIYSYDVFISRVPTHGWCQVELQWRRTAWWWKGIAIQRVMPSELVWLSSFLLLSSSAPKHSGILECMTALPVCLMCLLHPARLGHTFSSSVAGSLSLT